MRCGEGEVVELGSTERIPYPFGERRALMVEHCQAWGGQFYGYQRIDVSVWRGGDQIAEQTVFNGVATKRGLEYDVKPEVAGIELRYGCDEERTRHRPSKWCTHSWRWSSIYDRLVEVSVTEKGREAEEHYLRQLQTSLARRDFDRAARSVRQIAAATGRENVDWHMQLNRRVVTEIERRVERHRDEGETEEAAETAEVAFTVALPDNLDPKEFPPNRVWKVPTYNRESEEGAPSWTALGHFLLERTEPNARSVDTLARALADGGRSQLAIGVWTSAVEAFPNLAGMRLRLADALWKAGARERAGREYRAYTERTRSDGGSPPERAIERREPKDD